MNELYGVTNPSVANCLNNIGLAYSSLGEYNLALDFYNNTLEIQDILFGEKHPDIANTCYNVAVLYGTMGDFVSALKYAEKSLKISEEIFEQNHPAITTLKDFINEAKRHL